MKLVLYCLCMGSMSTGLAIVMEDWTEGRGSNPKCHLFLVDNKNKIKIWEVHIFRYLVKWIFKYLLKWIFEYLMKCIFKYLVKWICKHLVKWIFKYQVNWIFKYQVKWIFKYLVKWIFKYLCTLTGL